MAEASQAAWPLALAVTERIARREANALRVLRTPGEGETPADARAQRERHVWVLGGFTLSCLGSGEVFRLPA